MGLLDHLRVDKTCQKTGCGAPARFCPVLELRATRQGKATHQVAFGIALCTPCGRAVKAADLISDEGWAQLADAALRLTGAVVRRELTTVRLIEVSDG